MLLLTNDIDLLLGIAMYMVCLKAYTNIKETNNVIIINDYLEKVKISFMI